MGNNACSKGPIQRDVRPFLPTAWDELMSLERWATSRNLHFIRDKATLVEWFGPKRRQDVVDAVDRRKDFFAFPLCVNDFLAGFALVQQAPVLRKFECTANDHQLPLQAVLVENLETLIADQLHGMKQLAAIEYEIGVAAEAPQESNYSFLVHIEAPRSTPFQGRPDEATTTTTTNDHAAATLSCRFEFKEKAADDKHPSTAPNSVDILDQMQLDDDEVLETGFPMAFTMEFLLWKSVTGN
ncbi:hypothetical protein B5M09_000837 [Aphanomyces astaci]|uniref:Uncharacterized protein n=1 Tax=Aphanomyces astaci TaxID=112090 RepID=A0A425C4P1_APHAT|nr:hypothetical protein B5M09_000837 [Aphanomyces astaci]